MCRWFLRAGLIALPSMLVPVIAAHATVVLTVGDGGDTRSFGSGQTLFGPPGHPSYTLTGNSISAVSGPVYSSSYLGGLPSVVYAAGVVNTTDLSKYRSVSISKGTNGSPGDDDYGFGGGTSTENQPEILTLHGLMLFEQSSWTNLGDGDGIRFLPDGSFRATYRPTFPSRMTNATFSFAVRNGTDFYVHAGWVNATANQVLTLADPHAATWYQIDPLAYGFGGVTLGTGGGAIRAVAGSQLQDINAVGFAASFEATQQAFLQARTMEFNLVAIPEPSTTGLFALLAAVCLRRKRRQMAFSSSTGRESLNDI